MYHNVKRLIVILLFKDASFTPNSFTYMRPLSELCIYHFGVGRGEWGVSLENQQHRLPAYFLYIPINLKS